MFKVNEYFDGRVKSLAFESIAGPATVGVMAPGEYEFATSTLEIMQVVSGKLTVNCLNAYGGFMSILTTASGFNNKKQFSTTTRVVYIVGFVMLSMLVALLASSDFLNNFKNFVLLLLAVFVPWSAVNLVDY